MIWTPSSTKIEAVEEEEGATLNYGKEQYILTPSSFLDMCRLVGVPPTYAAKCPAKLIIPHINYWGNKSLDDFKILYNADTNVIETFSKSSTEFIPPSEIVEYVEKHLKDTGDLDYDKPHFSPDYCTLGITSNGMSFGEGVDNMNGGLLFSYSPNGSTPYQLSSYLMTLVCTNGLIAPVTVFSRRRNDVEDVESWIDRTASMAVEAIAEEADRVLRTKNYKISGHIGDVMSSVFDTYRVPTDIRDLVTERILNEGAETVYDIIEALTYHVSNDIELASSPKDRNRLMTAAGNIALHPEACPSCHRVFKN